MNFQFNKFKMETDFQGLSNNSTADNWNTAEIDEDAFIKEKSLEVFGKLNNMNINGDEVIIEKKRLSGISNTIYRIQIKHPQIKFKIDSLFFKIFGRISVLVNRQLETTIMESLNELGLGVKIYQTDLKTYRIEEFIEDSACLQREAMLDEKIYPRVVEIFTIINTFGDYEYYFDYVGDSDKSIYFHNLMEDKNMNIVNFIAKKMRNLAMESFDKFKQGYLDDNVEGKHPAGHIDYNNILNVEAALENLEKIVYGILPHQAIFAVNHNDGHPLNILCKPNYSKIYLCDFEYSSYNIIGFDMANYLIESFFLLEADDFPFYLYASQTHCSELKEDKYFQIFLSYFDQFEKNNSDKFSKMGADTYKKLLAQCRTRDYYYRAVCLSSILWFVFAVIYFNYESIKKKSAYDYFSFAVDRLNIYKNFSKLFG